MRRKVSTSPIEWHEQDWLLIAEALEEWTSHRNPSQRRWRASRLVFRISEYIDLSELEFENQTDSGWPELRYQLK